ncbi:hypothetical protein V6N13_036443 [Hibiscus sabdariffa]
MEAVRFVDMRWKMRDQLQYFLSILVRKWILANPRSSTRFSNVANWELLFGAVVWNIWLARNAAVFNSPSIFHNSIIQSSKLLVERMMTSISEVNDGVRAVSMTTNVSQWNPPAVG